MFTAKHFARKSAIPLLLSALAGAGLLYRFGEGWLRRALLYLSGAAWARRIVSNLDVAWAVASRFVAGETVSGAMAAAQALNAAGMRVTLDYLGESVTTATEANSARDEILNLLDQIEVTGVNANVSVKLSQLGVKIDPALALANVRQIAEKARAYNNKVRIDMEDSPLVDTTLEIYRTLRDADGLSNVGVVIQAYLHRSEADVRRLVEEGGMGAPVQGRLRRTGRRGLPQ
jgi:proline dehydrogenase